MMRLSTPTKKSSSPFYCERITHSTISRLQTLRKRAIVMQEISAKEPGRLKYQSTFWFGRSVDPSKTFKAGQMVEVCYREGNTWFVKAAMPTDSSR